MKNWQSFKKPVAVLISLVLLLGLLPAAAFAEEAPSAASPAFELREVPLPSTTAEDLPAMENTAVIELNENWPEFRVQDLTNSDYIALSELDELGRPGAAMACLSTATLPTEGREGILTADLAGWQPTVYEGLVEGGNLYNRCHLVAYMLCGINDEVHNLFTGTRFLNFTCMLPYENSVSNYIQSTGNHVLYRVTPLYRHEADLVPYGVQLEAFSVEDLGGLSFNVFIYNVQPGVIIDYATGESELDSSYDAAKTQPATEPEEPHHNTILSSVLMAGDPFQPRITDNQDDDAEERGPTYVLNTNTLRIHYPSCKSVLEMNDWNRKDFYGTWDELPAGYVACGRCNPR